jgi:hypothetical protein
MTTLQDRRRSLAAAVVAGGSLLLAVLVAWYVVGSTLAQPPAFFGGEVALPAADGPQAAAPSGGEDPQGGSLGVKVTVPAALVLDQAVPLDLVLLDPAGSRLDPDAMVEVLLTPELVEGALGWVSISPLQSLARAADLDPLRIDLHAFGELPCSESVGVLSIEVRELAEDGRSATERITLPGLDCAADAPPSAPAEVHQTEVVCRDQDWDGLAERLIDNQVLHHAECNPAPPPPAPEPEPEPEPEAEPEPEPEPGPEPEPEDPPATEVSTEDAETTGSAGDGDPGDGTDD